MKSSRRFSFPLWLILILCIFIFSIFILLLAPDKPKTYPPYLATSPSPTGVKAFYTYLKNESGVHTEEWNQSVDQLSDTATGSLMVMVEPNQPFTKNATQKWKQWIKNGNTLFLVVSDPKDFFNLKATYDHEVNEEKSRLTGENELSGHYSAEVATNARIKTNKQDKVLLKDSEGTLSVARPFGEGELVVLLEPQWLMNNQILKGDQLAPIIKIINRADPDSIWLNDAVHRHTKENGLHHTYPGWFVILIAQGALVLLLLLWLKGKRFGPVDLPREATIRINDERLRATAAWYMRGQLYKESLANQEAYLRQRLEDRYQISAQSGDDAMLDQLEGHLSREQFERWRSTWKELKNAQNHTELSKKAYLKWANALHNLLKEVDKQ